MRTVATPYHLFSSAASHRCLRTRSCDCHRPNPAPAIENADRSSRAPQSTTPRTVARCLFESGIRTNPAHSVCGARWHRVALESMWRRLADQARNWQPERAIEQVDFSPISTPTNQGCSSPVDVVVASRQLRSDAWRQRCENRMLRCQPSPVPRNKVK